MKIPKGDYSLHSLKEPGKYKINNGAEATFKLGGTYSVMLFESVNIYSINTFLRFPESGFKQRFLK